MRYLGHDGRCINRSEAEHLLDYGLGIGLIMETSASAALGGWGTGVDHGNKANNWADELDAPDVPIFYAVDFQPTSNELYGPIADYFRGAMSVGGRAVRAYGCAAVMQALCGDLGLFPDSWQCAAWSYPGTAPGSPIHDGGWDLVLSPYASMLQCIGYVLGDTSDHNNLTTADLSFMWGCEAPEPEDKDEDMHSIYHSKVGSEAVSRWGINNEFRQAFWVVNAQTVTYLGATDLLEPRQMAAKNWLALGGKSAQEYIDVPDEWLAMAALVGENT